MTRPLFALLLGAWLIAQDTTGSISGRIVSAATGRAIPGAHAMLFADDSNDRGASGATDAEGRFRFTRVAASRYWLRAEAPGYLSRGFGQEPVIGATLIAVRAGGDVRDLEIRLHRGGTIAGAVIDDAKESVVGGIVRAFAKRVANGDTHFASVGETRTDDRGLYRLIGLEPGQYVIGAIDRSAVTFAPASATPLAAVSITVGVDTETNGTNVQMRAVRIGAIAGLATGPGAVGSRRIELVPTPNFAIIPRAVAQLERGGQFAFADVPAGRYQVIARPGANIGDPQTWGLESVMVTGDATARTTIALRDGGRISGRVAPPGLGGRNLALTPVGDDHPEASLKLARPAADGSFTFSHIAPGRYRWPGSQSDPGADRLLISAYVKGQDVSDVPLVVVADTVIEAVRMVVTPTPARITGTVRDTVNKPTSDGAVVVAAVESRYWTPVSRRIRLARADTAGYFEVPGLPAGRYHVAYVSSLAPGQLWDPAFLRTLTGAREVTVAGGAVVAVQLRPK